MRLRLASAGNRRRRSRIQVAKQLLVGVASVSGRVLPWLFLILFVAGLPAAVVFGWGHVQALPAFVVNEVTVTGNHHMARENILKAIGYHGPGTNIFTIDPSAGEKALTTNEWVRTAHVERVLPNRVSVSITERQVGGLVMVGGLYLADVEGVPFKEIEFEQGIDTAIVTGVGDSAEELKGDDFRMIVRAFEIMKIYELQGLAGFDRLSEVQIDSLTGYALVTEKRRIRILLGEDRIEERLTTLGEVYFALEDKGIVAETIRLDSESGLDRIAVRLAEPRKVPKSAP